MHRRTTPKVIVALLAIFVLVLPASAQADRISFEARGTMHESFPPERTWGTEGRQHVRGWQGVYRTEMIEGVMPEVYTGTEYVTAHWNLDPGTMMGSMWGTAHMELDELDGGYTGSWVAKWRGTGCWTGHGAGHGYGSVEGFTVRYEIDCTGRVSGSILVSGGR